MISEDRIPHAPGDCVDAVTATPPKPANAGVSAADFFPPVARIDSIARHFRPARERAARAAAKQEAENASRDERTRRAHRRDVERAAIDTALHAAENEGWNTESAARQLRRPRSRPPVRCSSRPPRAR